MNFNKLLLKLTTITLFFENIEIFSILVLLFLTSAPSKAVFANSCTTFYNLTVTQDVSLNKPSERPKTLEGVDPTLAIGLSHESIYERIRALREFSNANFQTIKENDARKVIERLNKIIDSMDEKSTPGKHQTLDRTETEEVSLLMDMISNQLKADAVKVLLRFGSDYALYAIAKNDLTPELAKSIFEYSPLKIPIQFLKIELNTTYYAPPHRYYPNEPILSKEILIRTFGAKLLREYVRQKRNQMAWENMLPLIELLVEKGIEHRTLGTYHNETRFFAAEAILYMLGDHKLSDPTSYWNKMQEEIEFIYRSNLRKYLDTSLPIMSRENYPPPDIELIKLLYNIGIKGPRMTLFDEETKVFAAGWILKILNGLKITTPPNMQREVEAIYNKKENESFREQFEAQERFRERTQQRAKQL